MKKDIDSKDIISEGTLHEILLDIKYRLDHLEDIEADNRSILIKLIKQNNSIVKFLAQIDVETETKELGGVELPPIDKPIESSKIRSLRELIDEFMEKRKDLKELEEELEKNKDKITPGQVGES